MNRKQEYFDCFLEGARLGRVFNINERKQMKHAMEIIIKDPNGLKGYQTIGLAEASKLLNIPRYDVLKLWNKHNLPILKLSGSKQSAVRLYKYDFMSIQVALQKNYTDNVKKRRRSSPTP